MGKVFSTFKVDVQVAYIYPRQMLLSKSVNSVVVFKSLISPNLGTIRSEICFADLGDTFVLLFVV